MLRFLEVCLMIFFIFVATKEIMIPWWRGERAFPRFRKRKQLEGKRAEAIEKLLDKEMEVEIQELREQRKQIRHPALRGPIIEDKE